MRPLEWAAVILLLSGAVLSVVVGVDAAWIVGDLVMALVIVRTA